MLSALLGAGIETPWTHQRAAIDLASAGEHVVLATGTASGKSLGYLVPVLGAASDGAATAGGRGATAIYLAPTKALAADQLARIDALAVPGVRAATYDGDTPPDERRWIRDHANVVLTNPDLLHHSLLPGHERWSRFLRSLQYVVIDECHVYRGVFGSHVASVIRRLRRVAARYGVLPDLRARLCDRQRPRDPRVAPGRDAGHGGHAGRLAPRCAHLRAVGAATEDERRRSATTEAAQIVAELVLRGVQVVAFARSRAGAESLASSARRRIEQEDPALAAAVSAYRGGYLPVERRAIERALRDGTVRGLAATNALELGIDISGLDAVVLAGWPGRRASLWQQAGRAGRSGEESLAVLVAADDPLDTYLVRHPEAVFGAPVEATVLDPHNPHVLAPHLAAAAAELPLTEGDLAMFGARLAAAGRHPRLGGHPASPAHGVVLGP